MSGRQKRQRERPQAEGTAESQGRRKRLMQLGSAAAFLAIVVVAVLIVISQSQTSGGDTNLEGTAAVSRELRGIPQQGMFLGDPEATVTLVEFGDLQCPACKGLAERVLPAVIDSKVRNGSARLEFRNFTIIDEDSVQAGAAALAAGEQGRGWSYVELFYRNQGFEHTGYVTDDFLTEIARGAGVTDIGRWNRDRASKRLLDQISRTSAEARQLGFGGTPSFAIQGPATDGLEPLDPPGSAGDLEAAIDHAG